MLTDTGRLYAMRSSAYWRDIGTPQQYLDAQLDVIRGEIGCPPAEAAVERAPGVWTQGPVDIDADARIEAPVLLGEGTVVEAGARVAGSVLGAACRVGSGARVLRSVLHPGARLATDAEAIDAIVGAGAVVDVGAIASDHTVIGPHALVPPGARASGARIRQEV
jgi:NDP-sugar pyrophosphorylase family protein